MRFYHWLGYDHHQARREQEEREQRAIDEARIAAVRCPLVDDTEDE